VEKVSEQVVAEMQTRVLEACLLWTHLGSNQSCLCKLNQ
jgi:hypothetical protein